MTFVCIGRPRPVTYRQKTADRLILPSDAIPSPASNPQSRPPFFSRPCNLLPFSYMPILETLSNLFTWSPRHQRPPTPDSPVQQSPLSHGISEQLQRSQSFGVDGAADLDLRFSTSGDRSETPGLLPVSAHSPDVSLLGTTLRPLTDCLTILGNSLCRKIPPRVSICTATTTKSAIYSQPVRNERLVYTYPPPEKRTLADLVSELEGKGRCAQTDTATPTGKSSGFLGAIRMSSMWS